jgi:hypothetical protein
MQPKSLREPENQARSQQALPMPRDSCSRVPWPSQLPLETAAGDTMTQGWLTLQTDAPNRSITLLLSSVLAMRAMRGLSLPLIGIAGSAKEWQAENKSLKNALARLPWITETDFAVKRLW